MSTLATMKPIARRMMQVAVLLVQGLLVLGAGSGPARAQQAELQSYDVELIIFRTLSSDATAEDGPREADTGPAFLLPDEEHSPFDTGPADSGSSDTGSSDTGARTLSPAAENFPALPASRYQLTAIADTLRRSRNYRPLAHFGWTQPGYPRHAARFLSIDSKVPAGSGLSGRIALTRGRYLHLTLDLVLETATSPGHPVAHYRLQQSRRMRSNERHYIDHPNFGVIALITPSGE
ncbi:hypothetical protein ACG33_09325 [Steroidobacter denitrificans]|uniref:Peptidoglycan-binding protein CsiV n=1 Tax=Steroidobacter denitrificans TaxID=465721 RepID=A0A127FCC8_STEDE|nr:CsiV family protein [Steroidobacter denitrificans]AMN47290.1 hypothetical protein ACG33_09325 [Steroidobacter denitrificans]